jgi:hypothetical protein
MSSFFDYPASGQDVSGQILTVRGTSVADAGVKLVELQFGADAQWKTATGTESWSYTWPISSLRTGSYQIKVRVTDDNDETEMEPLRNVTVVIRQNPTPAEKLMVITFPPRLQKGDAIIISAEEADGRPVPFIRVDMEGDIYYDDNGDGVVDSDQNGMPILVQKDSGEILFTVTKEGYYVPADVRTAIEIYRADDPTLFVTMAVLAVAAVIVFYIWRKRKEPKYS